MSELKHRLEDHPANLHLQQNQHQLFSWTHQGRSSRRRCSTTEAEDLISSSMMLRSCVSLCHVLLRLSTALLICLRLPLVGSCRGNAGLLGMGARPPPTRI